MDLGQLASWLAGVSVGAAVICWMVIPGMVGLGTQRTPVKGDLEKPGDLSQWFFANVSRVSGDFAVTFARDRAQGRVAGTAGTAGDGHGKQFLPQSHLQNAQPSTSGSSMLGAQQKCAGPQDLNCNGVVELDELVEGEPR